MNWPSTWSFLLFIGRYVADTFTEIKFFLPGLLVVCADFCSLVFSSYRLTLYYGIRAGYSVVQTQVKVARLRYLELLEVNLLLMHYPPVLRAIHDCNSQSTSEL